MSATVDHHVAAIADIPPNEGRMIRVRGGHLIAVFRLREGGVRATQPWCPHRRGPLADGLVGSGALVCPLHGRTFDLDTGEAEGDLAGVVTYPARVEDGGVIVVSLPAGEDPLPCHADQETERGPAPGDDPPFAQHVEA